MKPSRANKRGHIEADSVYPVNVFMKRLGIGRHSLTALRRRGLPVRSIGTRAFIDGGEAVEFLRRLWSGEIDQGQEQAEKSAGEDAS